MILGLHLIADLSIDQPWLEIHQAAFWRLTMQELAAHFSMDVLDFWDHNFSGLGAVSAGVVLGRSHASVHTWPVYSYAALDLFSGSVMADITLDGAVKFLIEQGIPIGHYHGTVIRRGL